MQDSHPSLYSTKTLYHLYISDIHSDSVQKMLTALFKLFWNTQKITWTIFFKYQGKMFLNIKMFWYLNALPHCFFLHVFEVKVSNFHWPITWEIKQNRIGIKFITKSYSNGITTCKSFSILGSFFMPHVGRKWNMYLSLCF